MSIDRTPPSAPGRNGGSAFSMFVWVGATAPDKAGGIREQTKGVLRKLDENLLALQTDRSRLLSVQIFLADIGQKSIMDAIWREWIGSEPDNWPQRICVGAELNGPALIEIQATAVREIPT